MLTIETAGSWRDMGRQLGEAFAEELGRCVARFAGMAAQESGGGVEPSVARVRAAAADVCPDLLEETVGMAEGSGIPVAQLFAHRFCGSIRFLARTGCSSFFVRDAAGTPWLARTCDIEPEDHWHQLRHLRRPDDGCATLVTTYLGFAGGVGINEHGFGIVGVSGSTRETYGDAGRFASMLVHRVLHDCGDLVEANEVLLEGPALGKGQVWLAADASGRSSLYQVAPGLCPVEIPRPPERQWQACTNFQPRAAIPGTSDPLVLYNSYARYGWLSHQLAEGEAETTVEGLQNVLRGVSQPGPNIPPASFPLETAYASLFNLSDRTAYIAGGNPNAHPFEELRLS